MKGIASTPAKAAIAAKPYPAGQQAPMDDYDAKADMHTLIAANKIKADKGRHAKAKAAAKQHLAHLKQVVKGDGASGDTGASD